MKNNTEHQRRIRQELREAGMTRYGFMKGETRRLPRIIHENEHIHGVVYGLARGDSIMLVATDKRILILDWKPLFFSTDEVTYQVVSGVKVSSQGILTQVILHTRVKEFSLKYANYRCADHFAKYIEQRRLERDGNTHEVVPEPRSDTAANKQDLPIVLDDDARQFLDGHEVATFSTVDRDNHANGAVIYYYPAPEGYIYLLTKAETQKVHDALHNPHVALTIHDTETMQTLQLQGTAAIEADAETKHKIYSKLVHERQYGNDKSLPPVTKLKQGAFMVLRISPTSAKFRDFKKSR